ncbi:hypothetical protein BH10PSE9_BH10PSE9_05100 [soil metagenome]
MRFRSPLLVALLAVAADPHAAAAQAAAAPAFGLRGGLTDTAQPVDVAPAIVADEDGGAGRVLRQAPMVKGPEPDPLDNVATGTIRTTNASDNEDPFAAVGIRKGNFIYYPSVTATTGFSTNASGVAGGGGSGTLTLTPELFIQSDWARHEATLTIRGSLDKVLDGSQPDDPSASIEGTGRIDIKDGWKIDLDGRYGYSQQSISDPDFPAGVDSPPGVHDLSGSATLNGRFGRHVFELEGNVARTAYDNGTSAGLVVDQGDRTNNVFGARLRLGYETPLDVTPFVEAEIAHRAYDSTLDGSGLRRSSTATNLRAGVAFARDPVLSGDVAIGVAQQTFDDPALATLHALTVDGSLVWSPTRLVNVTFDAATTFSPSTDSGSSGSVVHDASVDVAYKLRRDFTLNWTGELSHQAFQGTNVVETNVKAGVSGTWKLSRQVWLTGGYVHEWLDSNAPGASFESDTVRLELRLQR